MSYATINQPNGLMNTEYQIGGYQYYASASQPMTYQLPCTMIQQVQPSVQQPQVMAYHPLVAIPQQLHYYMPQASAYHMTYQRQ